MAAASAANDVRDDVDVTKGKRLDQYLAAFVASLGGFVFGVSLGWNSSAGDTLRKILVRNSSEIGLIGTIFNVGAGVGIISLPFLVKCFTRPTIMLTSLPFSIIGWLLLLRHGKLEGMIMMILGRSICGLCSGIFCVLTPMYVAEIADKKERARLLMLFQLLVNCGIMYAFLFAHLLEADDSVWRYGLACAACSVVCFAVAFVYRLPETPLFYLTYANEEEAKNSLQRLRADGYKLNDELEEYKRLLAIMKREKTIRQVATNPRVYRAIAACFGVFAVQQLCGVHPFTFYALTIFNHGGTGELTGSQLTLVVGSVQILACILATLLIDVLGRRTLLILSSALMGLFLVQLGWFYNMIRVDPEYDDIYWWMPPTWTSLFFASYNFGVGPISYAMLGDILPMEIRMVVAVSVVGSSFLILLASTMTFGELFVRFGLANTMWLCGGCCWLGAVFCAFVVKDNGGKSLAEIQEEFDVQSSAAGEAADETGETG